MHITYFITLIGKDSGTKSVCIHIHLSGMKILLKGRETVDNYIEILNSYKNILKDRNEHINKLFEEIKTIKKLKV